MQHTHLAHMNMMHILDQQHKSAIWSSNKLGGNPDSHNDCNWAWASNNFTPVVDSLKSNVANLKFSSNTSVWASNFLYYSLKPISANATFTSNTATWTSNSLESITKKTDILHSRYTLANDTTVSLSEHQFTHVPCGIWKMRGDKILSLTEDSRFSIDKGGVYTLSFTLCFSSVDDSIISLVQDETISIITTKSISTARGSFASGTVTTFLEQGKILSLQIANGSYPNTLEKIDDELTLRQYNSLFEITLVCNRNIL